MKRENISDALNNIDFDMIEDVYESTKAKKKNTKSPWIKWGAIAACLCLIIMGGILGNPFRSPDTPDVPENNIMSYFVITAQAANGESTELSFASSCINSGKPKYNLFGNDMPVFCFDVKPSDLEDNEAVYECFDISISYNGTTVGVTDKDEHISIAYLASVHSSQTYGYSIFGWFTEPTDIFVTITDKESKAVVEEITVRVSYDANRQEYELKIINLDTEYVK